MKIDQFRSDLENLIDRGENLYRGIFYESSRAEFEAGVREELGDKTDDFLRRIPSFSDEYQSWYSEAKALIRQLLPDRLSDFVRHYEKPMSRRVVTRENYTLEDYFQGVIFSNSVGKRAGIPRFRQQLNIVKSISTRFESSLMNIRQLTQADLFDSELEVASELVRSRFNRAAGAVAGVVLERHFNEVLQNRGVSLRQKRTISNMNDALKNAGVIDTPQWRSIQHLADIRNLCVHDKGIEPETTQLRKMVSGVAEIIKTVY